MYTNNYLKLTIFSIVLILSSSFDVFGQSPAEDEDQLEAMIEMMKNSGVDHSQIAQAEAMLRGMADIDTRQKADALQEERREFREKYGAKSNASMVINGEKFAMTVTRCVSNEEGVRGFNIKAEQEPGEHTIEFYIVGGNPTSPNHIGFQAPTMFGDDQPRDLSFDGKTFHWSGIIDGSNIDGFNGSKLPVIFEASCD